MKIKRMIVVGAAIAALGICMGETIALEKEVSLVTKQPMGDLAVAGRLSIDLHAEFMASRSYGTETVLNWYNCGYSGGGGKDGKFTKVGGNFGDFGFLVPFKEREEKYPHAVTVDKVRAIRFDGGDFLKGNFAVEDKIAGEKNMAIEVWFRSEKPAKGDVILGWQSRDGNETSAPLALPANFAGSDKWRHLLVNCTSEKEDWHLDGAKISSGKRSMVVKDGHVMVLGGASVSKPSFKGDLVVVRLHDETMTDGEIAHNFKGGVMLGTGMHNWWRTEPDKWYVVESEHFRHALDKEEMKKWDARRLKEFNERVPGMFRKAELCYLIYSERMAMRSAVVSANADERGDGIKYRTPIQPHDRSVMGFDGRFGWACQGAGDINPHELVHGWQAMTGGGMEGSYWETHANFPQTYAGIYQTTPSAAVLTSQLHPANGRTYYDDRTFFEHLSQTPGYGPMIISKLWFDGAVEGDKNPSPWMSFIRLNPYPDRTLADEYIKMAMRNITWDYKIFLEAKDGLGGNTPYGNDGVENKENIYLKDFNNNGDRAMRHGRTILEKIPYGPEWWRVPKAQAPQQLGYNICPLKFKLGKVTATLAGYVDEGRGGDWRAGFVGVDKDGKPVYGETFGPGKTQSYDANENIKDLYLVVAAIPKKIMPIDGDYLSASQEQFPYKVKLDGCEPRAVLPLGKPNVPGKAHPNGGGFVADTAKVDATAYVGPNAQVLDKAVVSGNSRIEDFAVVSNDAKVLENAVVSEYAFVTGSATVSGNAKIRDHGKVLGKATVTGNAKILEVATIDTQKICKDNVTVKGCPYVYGGNQSGSAMIDGFYAKGQDITNGKWFTWSWGGGKNPGESDEDFGGLYANYEFDTPHGWMAVDSFGATWGYLINGARVEAVKGRMKYKPEAILPSLAPKKDIGENYCQSLRGYLLPPVTGDYTLSIEADDEGELWLGKAGTTVADEKICAAYIKPGSKSAATIRLEKGKAYPIKVLHVETHGLDRVIISWVEPGSDKKEVIEGTALSVTADGRSPGVCRRLWKGVSSLAELVKRPDYPDGDVLVEEGVLSLNGKDQFVELQRDIADMGNCTYSVTVKWDGATDGSRIFEFANAKGDAMWLSPSEGGKLVFAIRKGNTVEQVTAPAIKKGLWTKIQAIVDGKTASCYVNGRLAAKNKNFTLRPDSIRPTQCYLGRGAKGGYFGGEIDKFTVHCVALSEVKPLSDQEGGKTVK